MQLISNTLRALIVAAGLVGDIVPVPGTQPIMPLFERSDLVCNCVVESVRVVEGQTRQRGGKSYLWQSVLATITVRDSYKNANDDNKINVAFEKEMPTTRAIPTLSEGETGVMFLKLSPRSADYEFADKFLGITPFTSLPVQGGMPGPNKLQLALVAVIQTGRVEDQVRAMGLLQGFDSFDPRALSSLVPLSASADPEIALSSLAVLIKARTSGAVLQLGTYLRTHKISPEPWAMVSIGTELGDIRDLEDLVPLEALTRSEHLSIRIGAIDGIRNLRDPHSAGVLAERLDDPDRTVRYLATITLAEIFAKGGDYAPSMHLFDQDPDSYTGRWKRWWMEQKQLQSR